MKFKEIIQNLKSKKSQEIIITVLVIILLIVFFSFDSSYKEDSSVTPSLKPSVDSNVVKISEETHDGYEEINEYVAGKYDDEEIIYPGDSNTETPFTGTWVMLDEEGNRVENNTITLNEDGTIIYKAVDKNNNVLESRGKYSYTWGIKDNNTNELRRSYNGILLYRVIIDYDYVIDNGKEYYPENKITEYIFGKNFFSQEMIMYNVITYNEHYVVKQ